MANQLDIANRALLSVGARTTISSLNPSDGSEEGNAISILWQPTFEALGRSAHWNCLRKQVPLSVIGAAQGTPENPDGTLLPIPDTPWLYMYQYPSDCLDFWYIVPSFPANTGTQVPQTTINNAAGTWLPSGGQIPFLITTYNPIETLPLDPIVILTNQSQAQGVYSLNNSNPGTWDSLFQAAMVSSLAAYLVPALSLSLPLMQLSIKTAETAIAMARARDGNEGVTTQDHTPDWFQARAGAQGFGWGWPGNTAYSGFYNMVWPGGGGGPYGD